MKKFKYIALAAMAAMLAAGCEKENKGQSAGEGSGPVAGEWHMVSWSGLTEERADVYVSFGEDGTFDLYQRVYTPYYEHYDGTYRQDGDRLSGSYSDGTPWGREYTATLPEDRSRLTLTAADDGADVSVYVPATIPEDILSGDLSLKSGTGSPDGFRFL